MHTFKVYISRQNPPAIQGVYDYSETVLAVDQNTAANDAYNKWAANTPGGVPLLANCYVNVTQVS